MSTIPEDSELRGQIEAFSRAYQRWEAAASARAVLLQIQEGELPPPMIEVASTVENGESVRVGVDLSGLAAQEAGIILGPMLDFLYREYKRCLFEAGTAATASHSILESQEHSGSMGEHHHNG